MQHIKLILALCIEEIKVWAGELSWPTCFLKLLYNLSSISAEGEKKEDKDGQICNCSTPIASN